MVAGFRQFRRQLAVLPTGAGKTILFAKLAQAFQPGRTLVVAHREELERLSAMLIFPARTEALQDRCSAARSGHAIS